MDSRRFDALSKSLAQRRTRREVLRGLAALTMGAAFGTRVGGIDAAAEKLAICHHTNSDSNQYEYITVAMSAADQHQSHHGDAIGVDLMTSNAHCGTCGNACASGQICSQGTCVPAPPSCLPFSVTPQDSNTGAPLLDAQIDIYAYDPTAPGGRGDLLLSASTGEHGYINENTHPELSCFPATGTVVIVIVASGYVTLETRFNLSDGRHPGFGLHPVEESV